ncbi:MAG: sulfatase-like hydrolase/transferase [Bradymonadia bacterium]
MAVRESNESATVGWLLGPAVALIWVLFLERINQRLFCEIAVLNAYSFYLTGTLALCVFPFLARWANRDWSRLALQSAPMFFAALHWFELLLERDAVSRLSGYVLWKPVLAVVGPMCFAAFAVWLYTTGHRRKSLLLRMCLGIGFLGLGWALDGTYVKFASASWLISGLLLFTHPLRLAGAKRLACLYVVASIPLFFISKLSTTYNQHGICSPLYWSIETVKQRLGISDDNRQSFKPDAAYRKELIRRYSVPKGGSNRDVKHVLLVVLESIRWNSWADESLAPNFHRWRRHGTYVPNAVAQYPATPLAYGAMFTSQTPSVLVQNPGWKPYRPMDKLRGSFDSVFLSRPKNRWFDDDAIVSFISDHRDVSTHKSAAEGLERLIRFLKSEPKQSKFAWIHLYEPHRPWQGRPEFLRGDAPSKKEKYESEIRYTDQELGRFMSWFYKQDFADETLVIVIADHGQGLGEPLDGKPFYGHHVHVKTNLSWVPFYISGPGIKSGQLSRTLPVTQLDVMPTIFDFVGQELPVELLPQGTSVRELIKSPTERAQVTEAFSIRGSDFFRLINTSQSLTTEIAQDKFKVVSRAGRYPPKIGLQLGSHKLIYNQLANQHALFDIGDGGIESTPLDDEFDLKNQLMESLARWRQEQAWIIENLPFTKSRRGRR